MEDAAGDSAKALEAYKREIEDPKAQTKRLEEEIDAANAVKAQPVIALSKSEDARRDRRS